MVVKVPNLTASFQGHPNTRKNEIQLKNKEKEREGPCERN